MNSIKKCQCYAWLFHLFPSTSLWLPETDGAILPPAGPGLTHYRKLTEEKKSGVDIEHSNHWTRLHHCSSPIQRGVGGQRSTQCNCGVVLFLNVPKIWNHKDVFDDHYNPDDWPQGLTCCQISSANWWQMLYYVATFCETSTQHEQKSKNVLWNWRIQNVRTI